MPQLNYISFSFGEVKDLGSNKRDFGLLSIGGGIGEIALKEVLKTEYQYKYNTREYQDELGLNWTSMDFRNYDAAIGRFVTIDPLAELSQEWTTYKFAYNNPVYWRDPSGLIEFTYDKDGTTVTGYTGSESEMAAAGYFANNEGASLDDFETYVWNSMDAGEDVFTMELEEVTITVPSIGEQIFNYATDQISPILEGAQVMGGTLINGLYGVGAALAITIDEATWTKPADEQRVRMRMRNLQLPISMKIYGFRNGRWDYHDFENMSSEQQQDYVMKLLMKNGTMGLPTIKFLKNAPPGLNETIQSTLIEQATSEWLDSLE